MFDRGTRFGGRSVIFVVDLSHRRHDFSHAALKLSGSGGQHLTTLRNRRLKDRLRRNSRCVPDVAQNNLCRPTWRVLSACLAIIEEKSQQDSRP